MTLLCSRSDFGTDDKVCVVAVIGKERLLSHRSKATRLNSIIGEEVFRVNRK